MSIKVALEHRTTYRFARPVAVGPHVIRLRPAPHTRTPIEAYSLEIEPAGHFINWQQDPFGNWLARVVFPDPVPEIDVTVGLVADMMVINPFDFFIEEYAEKFPFAYEPSLRADLAPYLRPVDEDADGAGPGPVVTQWVRQLPELPEGGMGTVDFLVQVNSAVHDDVAYSVRMEPGVQTPDHTLTSAIGSCRDSAWLMVSVLRQYGLAARFVSGYLVQLAPDDAVRAAALDGPSGPAEDFTDLHAWAEVYIPGAGWVGLDPTSALFAGEGHIPLSATPHPSSAAPITGVTEPVEVEFGFHNVVRRVHEDPRVTQPYDEATWQRVDALGEAVDARLRAGDVRLTMGGEPTFVAVDDQTSAEWNTAADGPHKRDRAAALADALREIYARGGVVHRGQGKWYPGEELPRWQIAMQWRTDGVPLWQDPGLLAEPWDDATADPQAATRAADVAREITRQLGLPEPQLLAAFEDPLAVVAHEVRLPAGPRPEPTEDPQDPHDPAEFAAGFDREVTEPSGWVLPIVTGESWRSPTWRFRRGRLVLLPGTSPLGLRLPLDSINWTDPEPTPDPSYMSAAEPLCADVPSVEVVDSSEGEPTTALAIEARDGFVFCFLPPTERLEDYTALVAVIEQAAATLHQPVVIEGYGPPPDPRLTQLVVTPDPGVIEVNLQPTSTWAELRDLTTTLYATAVGARLGTEKFDLDGLHTGTGGGNHITLGGPSAQDSPLLRRPDLLASIVRYWQRHPSLSYLFSGRFIGPTSQAPRFDEGRPEAVYEMEIALAEIRRLTRRAKNPRPWIVDRALRHLLTDLTGNTHRAELCIDKLYSPDSSRGRLGLLEMRGFEMPPHAQMGLVQALLVRSLVTMFWEKPYTEPLIRWGTRLHDDMMSPWGVERDIAEVVDDLHNAGIDFELGWLAPFFEFRFPRIGSIEASGVQVELRAAVEPWNVLGEEATGSGTARYVDSSVERLQIHVTSLDPLRRAITCNGVAVPLTPSGLAGEYVAGVRYRAWQPPSALHPSIAVQAPLTVEVVDLDSGLSLGGCTYHVVHPGGRAYETPPINAQEAESRRSARFDAIGHTAGPIDARAIRVGSELRSPDYPFTLDLRRFPPKTRRHQPNPNGR